MGKNIKNCTFKFAKIINLVLSKNHVFNLVFLISSCLSFSQVAILCSLQTDEIKIESTDYVPTVTNNPDGTITLTYQDQNITDIFADYIIYDFYQAYPTANPDGELFKYYTIVHGNRALFNEIYNYSSPDVHIISPYAYTSLNSELIVLLDGKTYKLLKYCTESTEGGFLCPEGEQNVPDDFQLNIAFEYDAIDDMMHAQTAGVSSCGNFFSIRMKGEPNDGIGTTNNRLQLWESEPGTSISTDYSLPCHNIEKMLYSVLDIGCQEGHNYGNIRVNMDTGNLGEIVLERENALFATDFLTFQDNELSIEENSFNNMRPFQIKGNPYLQVSNLNNQSINIDIYNVSGQHIIKAEMFEENSLDISNLSRGLYFIRLSDLNNQQKIFKLLLD